MDLILFIFLWWSDGGWWDWFGFPAVCRSGEMVIVTSDVVACGGGWWLTGMV